VRVFDKNRGKISLVLFAFLRFDLKCRDTPQFKKTRIFQFLFTPHQTGIFLEILFKIRNQRKILRKKVTFRTPNLQTPIKPVGNIFDRRDPKKPPLN
jgi:hypothetical protein